MDIGVPAETKQGEGRVSLTPGAIADLVHAGHHVSVETKAGMKSGFTDEQYRRSGAAIKKSAKELYDASTLIVKVKEPLVAELPLLRSDHQLFCYLHLAANPHLIDAFKNIGCTAFAFEAVEVAGDHPLLAPMSDIAGKVSIQLGMHYSMIGQGGSGILLEGSYGAPRANVVVLGGGVAGYSAAARAAAIGANVTVFDLKSDVLRKANELGPNVTGLYSQADGISESVKKADLVIGAVLMPGKRPPIILSKALIREMKPGSVVVDIAIDQGGCVEGIKPTTHADPCYQLDGVQILAVTNLPGAVPQTSTLCLSGAVLPYVLSIAGDNARLAGLEESVCVKNNQLIHA